MSNAPPGPGGPGGSPPVGPPQQDDEDLAQTVMVGEGRVSPFAQDGGSEAPAVSPSQPPPVGGLPFGGFGSPPGAPSQPPEGAPVAPVVGSAPPPVAGSASPAARTTPAAPAGGGGLPLPPPPEFPRHSGAAPAPTGPQAPPGQPGPTTPAAAGSEDKKSYVLEVMAAIVLGLGTMFGAYAAYQSALWGGNCMTNYNKGAITMNQASATMLLGVQMVMMDGIMFIEAGSQRLLAESHEQPARAKIADYIETELMLDDFKVPLVWAAKFDENPFEFPGLDPGSDQHAAVAKLLPAIDGKTIASYEEMRMGEAMKLAKEGQQLFEQGQQDNANGDAFTLVTVFFTIVLFFGGLATVLRRFALKTVFFTLAVVILVGSSVRMFSLPFAKAAPPTTDAEAKVD